ncbi:MAG TPA: hypothetical protein VLX12_02330, partial [Syntrophorhabdales bacterium]|nr:hypothetical protein [Syntrophorhabdales bacterium]
HQRRHRDNKTLDPGHVLRAKGNTRAIGGDEYAKLSIVWEGSKRHLEGNAVLIFRQCAFETFLTEDLVGEAPPAISPDNQT